MAETSSPADSAEHDRVLIFDRDEKQARAYAELFRVHRYEAEVALPSDDVQTICERLRPSLVIFDMAFWEADAAHVFGVLNTAIGFSRPVIIGVSTLDVQARRAKRFGADGSWIRGVDDATGLPQLARELLEKRRVGKLLAPSPRTPL